MRWRAVRSQRELGIAAAGAGGVAAGGHPAASAGGQDLRTGGHEVSGASGARQLAGLRTNGGGIRAASLRHTASRTTVRRLAQRLAGDPPTHSRSAGAVFQSAAASGAASPAAPAAALLRELEIAAAIVNRATRRLAGAAGA